MPERFQNTVIRQQESSDQHVDPDTGEQHQQRIPCACIGDGVTFHCDNTSGGKGKARGSNHCKQQARKQPHNPMNNLVRST